MSLKIIVSLTFGVLPQCVLAAQVSFSCMIEPKQIVDIRSPVVGTMKRLYVSRGDEVLKGQKLVELDSGVQEAINKSNRHKSNLIAQTSSASSKLAAAKKKAERFEELYREQFVSAQARDDAKNDVEMAKAELKLAIENKRTAELDYNTSSQELDQRLIRSPLNGVVIEQYLNQGSTVGPTEGKDPILRIAQYDVLKVTTIIPFKYFNSVHSGQTIRVVPEAPFSKSYAIKIAKKDKVVDSASGTFRVVSYISNSKGALPGGILCKSFL